MSIATLSPYGEIQGSSLTGSYQTILTPSGPYQVVQVFNDCDKPIIMSFDGGNTETHKLNQESFVLDISANAGLELVLPIKVKHAGSAPSLGSIRVSIIK